MRDFDRKFLFVTGKGGVGKSTISVALARALAARGRRVLLALCEPGPSAHLLGVARVGTQIQSIAGGLSAVVLEPNVAVREYGELVLPNVLASALVGNRYSRTFLAAVPGLNPWAMLGKAWYHTTEQESGRTRFDHVVFDGPATGHALQMLRVPKVITLATAPGVLKRDAESAWAMLTDPKQAKIVVVTVPELSPVQETLELTTELAAMGLGQAEIVLNGSGERVFDAQAASEFAQLDLSALSEAGRAVATVARERIESEALEQRLEAELSVRLGHAPTVLPWLDAPDSPAGIAALGQHFAGTAAP
jgi:anion-transporting  ArsA/GET3 family ATPase